MKIAIVGSRPLFMKSPAVVEAAVHNFVNSLPPGTIVISGRAQGVDTWAEEAAKKYGYTFIPYPADWKQFGSSAGYRRNAEMVLEANKVVAFWNGKSKGTQHTINIARQAKKLQRVFYVTPND